MARQFTLLLAVTLGACDASIVSPSATPLHPPSADGGGSPGGPAPGQPADPLFTCDPMQVPDELPLPRLSHAQLSGALRAAIQLASPTDADTIWTSVSDTFGHFPADAITPAPGDIKGGFGRTDQA